MLPLYRHRLRRGSVIAMACIACMAGARATSVMAGPREDSVLDELESLRRTKLDRESQQLGELHRDYSASGDSATRQHLLTTLALGVRYLEQNPRLAIQYLSSAAMKSPASDPLLPIIRFYLAAAKLAGGDSPGAVAIAQGLLKAPMGAPWERQIYGLLIEGLSAQADYPRLTDVFNTYARQYAFTRRQEHLAHRAVDAFERLQQWDTAASLLEDLARNYPTTAESRWAFRRLVDLSCDTGAVARLQGPPVYRFSLKLLHQLARNAVLDPGLSGFVKAATDMPVVVDGGEARLLTLREKAEFFLKARMHREALAAYTAVHAQIEAASGDKDLPATLFELGRVHMRLAEPMLAARNFSRLITDHPRHELVGEALEGLGDAMRYLGMHKASADLYAEAAKRKSGSGLRWQHFWASYRGHRYQEALGLLETPGYVTARPGDERETVAYWHARLLERLGRHAEAKAKFQEILANDGESFYAELIASRHPELVGPAGDARQEVAGGPGNQGTDAGPGSIGLAARILDRETLNPGPQKPELRVVDELMSVGLLEAAGAQLAALRWSDYGEEAAFTAISRLAVNMEDYSPTRRIRFSKHSSLKYLPKSWWDIADHQRRHLSEWRLYYPYAFEQLLAPVSERIHIDPFLVLSVMRAESFYNREARSPVGAVGLMQVMPYTAAKIASLLRDPGFEETDLADPALNVPYGAYYLERLLRYYGANPFLAVAAYNAGPVAVNQWLDSCRDCEIDEFADSIPYRETRRYVRKVMHNYAQYGKIYRGKSWVGELPPMPLALPDGVELF